MAPKKKATGFKSLKTPVYDSPIPTPFTKAPTPLAAFTDRLDPSKVYISHIDRHQVDTKKRIFLIPVILNFTIAALLLYRAYTAAPTYLAILETFLGYISPATVDVEKTTRNEQIWIVVRRTAMFMADFLLFRFVGPWPLTFFFEQPSNPCAWRWNIGFRPAEVVVRVSRHWGTEDLMQGVRQGEENAFFKTRVMPAIGREMMAKTGYLMMDKSWDLDFEVMCDAHTLEERKEVELKALDEIVFAFLEGSGWLIWRWRGDGDGDVTEERRKKVVAFKEKLTKMGKESLFWRWMEIVEEERDRDGGFTPERQQKVAARVQEEFESNGVDFDELTKSVGGLEEVQPKSK